MFGAIAGDILGSVYEGTFPSEGEIELYRDDCHFTDDTVLTCAIADAILTDHDNPPYDLKLRQYYNLYPNAGYGMGFVVWARSPEGTIKDSLGNGCLMRCSPIAWAYEHDQAIGMADKSCYNSHHNPNSLYATRQIISRLRLFLDIGADKNAPVFIKEIPKLRDIVPKLELRAVETLLIALACFNESNDIESAIKNAISIGGDTDTNADIAAALAQAYYKKVPKRMQDFVLSNLDDRLTDVLVRFEEKYGTASVL